jgi:hypothetical protein
MSQQLQKECFVCHQQIYLSKNSPDQKGWNKTNLDGTEHIDPVKPRGNFPQTTHQTTFSPEAVKERQQVIQQSHEENIEASKDLTAAIRELAAAIRESKHIE